ncbi:hypothetical protein LTR53_005699 [Teratosphaeriaceae sp. CCFEE 6253]|nr:hypothetical protein LTR53_005699 [Teratosphaeriaceae sp. CCFEE 6253]
MSSGFPGQRATTSGPAGSQALPIQPLLQVSPRDPLYQCHVLHIIDSLAFGREGERQLQELIGRLRAQAVENGAQHIVEEAVAALTTAWCERVAKALTYMFEDQNIMAETTAIAILHKQQQLFGAERAAGHLLGNARAFLNKVWDTACQEADAVEGTPEPAPRPLFDTEMVARGVDIYWDRLRLANVAVNTPLAALAAAFKAPQDIFVANCVAMSEFEASQQRHAFDLRRCHRQAVEQWGELWPRQRAKYKRRLDWMLEGDVRMIVTPELDRARVAIMKGYAHARQPLCKGESATRRRGSPAPSVGEMPW